MFFSSANERDLGYTARSYTEAVKDALACFAPMDNCDES